jgi:hypothetical protein
MPCLRALRRDHDFPCAVRGPVDREALRRLAAALRGEVLAERVIVKMMTSLKDSADRSGEGANQTTAAPPLPDAPPLHIVIREPGQN